MIGSLQDGTKLIALGPNFCCGVEVIPSVGVKHTYEVTADRIAHHESMIIGWTQGKWGRLTTIHLARWVYLPIRSSAPKPDEAVFGSIVGKTTCPPQVGEET